MSAVSERVKKVVAKKSAVIKTEAKKLHRLPVIYQIRHKKITIDRKPPGRDPKPYVPQTRLDRWVWDTLTSYSEEKAYQPTVVYQYTPSVYTPSYETSSTVYTPVYTPSASAAYTPSAAAYTPSAAAAYTPSASAAYIPSYTPSYTPSTSGYTKV